MNPFVAYNLQVTTMVDKSGVTYAVKNKKVILPHSLLTILKVYGKNHVKLNGKYVLYTRQGNLVWPQGSLKAETNNVWSCTDVTFGPAGVRSLMIAKVNEDVYSWFKYYWKVAETIGHENAIPLDNYKDTGVVQVVEVVKS